MNEERMWLSKLVADRRAGLAGGLGGRRIRSYGQQMEELYFIGAGAALNLGVKLHFMKNVGTGLDTILELLGTHLAFMAGLQHSVNKGKTSAVFTSYLLRWLPWLSLLASQILGLPTLNYLFFEPFGWALLATAVGLSLLAGRVARKFVKAVTEVNPETGLWLSLAAGSIKQGAGVNRTIAAMREANGGPVADVERNIRTALVEGGSVAVRLEAAAQQARDELVATKDLEVERLPFKLLIPLGAFLIPQFLILLVVPMILAVIAGDAPSKL